MDAALQAGRHTALVVTHVCVMCVSETFGDVPVFASIKRHIDLHVSACPSINAYTACHSALICRAAPTVASVLKAA